MATATKVRSVISPANVHAPRRVPQFLSFDSIPPRLNSLTAPHPDEGPRYERDNRSASPRPLRDENDGGRRRSASPGGNNDR